MIDQTRRNLVSTTIRDYIALLSLMEPQNISLANQDGTIVKAMNEELGNIERNETWEYVPKPKDKKLIGTKWVYKISWMKKD